MAGNSIAPSRKTTIEIPIPSIRKYVPGSGPPLPKITLAPPRDSTAYIIDQFVLPVNAETTETSRRLIYYHIGFIDLPAVKILIPCNKVLDYVSPRELEDWEYNNLETKEEERARELAERQRLRAAAKEKAALPSKLPDNEAPVNIISAEETLLLAKQVAGPSLSTPQKRKLGVMLAEEDAGETSNLDSDDAAILKRLRGEVGFEDAELEEDLDADSESVHQLAIRYNIGDAETPSRATSSAPLLQDSSTLARVETGVQHPTVAAQALTSSVTSTPGRIHPAWAHVFGLQNRSESLNPDQDGHLGLNGLEGKQSSPVLARPNSSRIRSSASAATLASAGRAGSSLRGSTSRFPTPGASATSAVASNSSINWGLGGQLFKALPKGPSQQKQSKKADKKKQQEFKHQDEPAEDEWEVKELLDDRWVFEGGVKVHKYLVLWEGDWPEDQNPTWEPAENIQDKGLIKRYEKKKKAGLLKPPPSKYQKTLHRCLPRTQYSSVAEAFAGGIEEQTGPLAAGIESDTDPPDETFLVTENAADYTPNRAKPAPSFQSFDSMLARYNQSFPRV
ncbi:hypothetical protein VTK56DRAFT_1709 [Thermocarpiscus australiensis]